MSFEEEPLVSVVTPVYNTEEFLEECIKSVLSQTYSNFEHVIVDNCSTDQSAEIAESYAQRDSRIRVVRSSDFRPQANNYNYSLRQISNASRYCKVVQADDWLYPHCLSEMVAVAENHPSVGVVGAFTLLDFGARADVYLFGLPYGSSLVSGRDLCRSFLLESKYVFGSPTATMFRSDIVRSRAEFYDEHSVSWDTKIHLDVLQDWDFGFVHQVLTYTRRYNDSYMSVLKHYHFKTLTEMMAVWEYGPVFLDGEECARRRSQLERTYHRALGESLLRRMPKEFWDFQRRALADIGVSLSRPRLVLWGLGAVLDLVLNPKLTAQRILRYRRRDRHIDVDKVKEYVDV